MTTIRELLDSYREYDIPALKTNTARSHTTALNRWTQWHDDNGYDIETADTKRVKRWSQALQQETNDDGNRKVSDETIQSYLISLQGIYSTLHTDDGVDNIVKGVSTSHLEPEYGDDKDDEIKYISVEDARKLLRACNEPVEKVVIGTLLHCGLRLTELRHLKTERIETDKNRLKVRTAKRKGHPIRTVFVPASFARVLENWIDTHRSAYAPEPAEDSPYLLTGMLRAEKMTEEHIRDTVVETAKKAGIQARNKNNTVRLYTVTPHTLRHTYGVIRAGNNINLANLADLMGHASVDITRDYYLQFGDNDLQDIDRRTRTPL